MRDESEALNPFKKVPLQVTVYNSHFSERLVFLRKKEGLSQEDLAMSLGMVRTTVTMYETGRAVPSLKIFVLLCQAIKATPNDLLGFNPR